MQRLGGAVIPMQPNFNNIVNDECLDKINFLVGNKSILKNMSHISVKEPFADDVIDFLNSVSKALMSNRLAKIYPDVVTLGFWLRKASIMAIKKRFVKEDGSLCVGRGMVFHVAPSNVPVNYAYSLVVGLLTGNANVVRIPSKDFPQVKIINDVFEEVLQDYEEMKDYLCLVRYERDKEINDWLSYCVDARVIWGGDSTIAELRKSVIQPRTVEVTFADRYSFVIINSDDYMQIKDKKRVAQEFYNDTFLTDQNACTSPRLVVWVGNAIVEAKSAFWDNIQKLVEEKYQFQPIQGINKLTSAFLIAAKQEGTHIVKGKDNRIVRVCLESVDDSVMEHKDNSGYFFEYDCKDFDELRKLCNNTHCQTVSYVGDIDGFKSVLTSGVKGVDRIVPVGKTMDFDFIWDGYNLVERLTRSISIM